MTNIIDLEGLPAPVARAITETVLNLKNTYRETKPPAVKPVPELPISPGSVIGSLRRIDIYDEQ